MMKNDVNEEINNNLKIQINNLLSEASPYALGM
jgi:hypothetical protein